MHYPRHLGIIPDWNRTRAKKRWLPSIVGHQQGFENFQKLSEYIFEHTSIEIVTSRWASTENIHQRSQKELAYLYKIYQKVTQVMKNIHNNHGIGFKWIGSPVWLPTDLVEHFYTQEKIYPSNNGKYAILAVNYGWNDEILRGINTLLSHVDSSSEITAELLSQHMDLGKFPPVELIIRTKGEMAKRLSGFMTWWMSYAEIYFSDKLFPSFDISDLQEVLKEFDARYMYQNFWK